MHKPLIYFLGSGEHRCPSSVAKTPHREAELTLPSLNSADAALHVAGNLFPSVQKHSFLLPFLSLALVGAFCSPNISPRWHYPCKVKMKNVGCNSAGKP